MVTQSSYIHGAFMNDCHYRYHKRRAARFCRPDIYNTGKRFKRDDYSICVVADTDTMHIRPGVKCIAHAQPSARQRRTASITVSVAGISKTAADGRHHHRVHQVAVVFHNVCKRGKIVLQNGLFADLKTFAAPATRAFCSSLVPAD